jgi:hypothetical protein
LVGSTAAWERHGDAMSRVLEEHDEASGAVFVAHGGYVFSRAGDSFAVAFSDPAAALAAAESLQEAMAGIDAGPVDLEMRVGIHTGVAVERGGDYFGPPVNLAARVMGEAAGGSVVLSAATATLLSRRGNLLGDFRLKGVEGVQQLYGAGPSDAVSGAGRLRSTEGGATTTLLGRSSELSTLADLFESQARLISLVGPGGIGKTRLAHQAASDASGRFASGVAVVDLRMVAEAPQLGSAVAAGLGLEPDVSGAVEQLCRYVTDRDVLLVLDNCEHVVDAVADLVAEFA